MMHCREDVVHLSLYNLSVIHKKKYFDSEMELMSYINDNWELLQLGEVTASYLVTRSVCGHTCNVCLLKICSVCNFSL